jgi:ATP-binding cassette, subfamily A (ABC1), member 3
MNSIPVDQDRRWRQLGICNLIQHRICHVVHNRDVCHVLHQGARQSCEASAVCLWFEQSRVLVDFVCHRLRSLLLAVFGFSVLPYTYLWSFLFEVPSSGLARLVILYIVTGVFAFLAYFIMNNDLLKLQWIAKPLGWVMLVSPHFSLVRGMNNLNSIQSTMNLCEKQCSILPMCDEVKIKGLCKLSELKCGNITSPVEMFLCPLQNSCCSKSIYSFKEDGIGLNIAAMVLVGIISLIILFIVEYRWVPSLYGSCKNGMR